MPSITGPLTTVNPSNTYATHDEGLGRGGYRTVANAGARDAIPAERRAPGMIINASRWPHEPRFGGVSAQSIGRCRSIYPNDR